ncbi:hypothetical protein M9434_003393 [Picochlorum sp. BPE23]|nr:hypothetical protein M9434_003393 [Picochlorum sp. BPE23]
MTWLPAEILLVSAGNRISSDLPQFRHIVADQIHNAAANRNIGGQEARCKYITFFDVDDVPHPARFENIELLIRRFTNVDALLFPFQFLQEGINIWEEQAAANQEPSCISMKGAHCNDPLYRSRKLYEMCYLEHWLENREPPFVLCCKDDYFTIAANGWLTVRKELFMELQYNSSMRIAEDGDLNARIIHSGGNLMIWDMKLGLYNFQRYKFISDRID